MENLRIINSDNINRTDITQKRDIKAINKLQNTERSKASADVVGIRLSVNPEDIPIHLQDQLQWNFEGYVTCFTKSKVVAKTLVKNHGAVFIDKNWNCW